MLKDKIQELQVMLNAMIINNENSNSIYNLSTKLDDVITDYYKELVVVPTKLQY